MTTPQQFRKKPVVIDAMQLTSLNIEDVEAFVGDDAGLTPEGLLITTLEGAMHASVGDWIIRGVAGEFYPCKHDIFEKTYEPVFAPGGVLPAGSAPLLLPGEDLVRAHPAVRAPLRRHALGRLRPGPAATAPVVPEPPLAPMTSEEFATPYDAERTFAIIETENGDFFASGHVEVAQFRAEIADWLHTTGGDHGPDGLTVEHLWALTGRQATPEEGAWFSWEGVAQSTPGAFAVTRGVL